MAGLLGGGGGGGTAPVLNKEAFDLSSAVKKYGGFTDEQIAAAKNRQNFTNQANQALITQLQGQTTGAAPSLAQAQLKSMQDRGLAQTLAVAASQRGGNPALQARNLAMQQAAAGRANASQGAILGLQERQAAQALLANQLTAGQGQADNLATGSIGQGFGQENTAKQLMGQYESQRFAADTARQNAIHAQQGNILGSVLGAAGTVVGGMYGGPAGAAIGRKVGGAVGGAAGKYDGGLIEGKEVVEGDHPANDIVDIKVSPGELVIPKSVVEQGHHAVSSFAEAIMKQHTPSKEVSYASVARAKMYEGGRVPVPKDREEQAPKSKEEKPVQNQWHGLDEALNNVKKELGFAKKSSMAYGGMVKAKKKGC